MKKTFISAAITLCFLAISINISAQSRATKNARKINEAEMETFQKLIDDQKTMDAKTIAFDGLVGNYEKKYNINNGFCTQEDYKIPKKVGILAFYITDNDYSVYTPSTITSYKATSEKVNTVIQRVFDQSIDEMKKQYAQLGMEFLTPSEFLTTDSLKNIYYNMPLPNLENKASIFGVEGSGAGVPDGFRLLPYLSMIATGAKFAKERDAYFNALGMDAYIIVDLGLVAANGSIDVISSIFYYKNPGYNSSDKVGEYAVGYTPYTAGYVEMRFKPAMKALFIKEEEKYITKKGKTDIKFLNVDINQNLSVLVSQVVGRLGELSVEQIIKPIKVKKKKKKK